MSNAQMAVCAYTHTHTNNQDLVTGERRATARVAPTFGAGSTAGFHGIDGKVAFTPNPDGFTLSTPSDFAYKFRASKGFNIWWMATDEN